jgi:hypothetical protein
VCFDTLYKKGVDSIDLLQLEHLTLAFLQRQREQKNPKDCKPRERDSCTSAQLTSISIDEVGSDLRNTLSVLLGRVSQQLHLPHRQVLPMVIAAFRTDAKKTCPAED